MAERLSTEAIGAVCKVLDIVLFRSVAMKCMRLDNRFADHFGRGAELDPGPIF